MDCEIIYLDHAAATPLDQRVLAAMEPYFTDNFYNPSSPYMPAVKVRQIYEESKHKIASLIGAKPADIIITAGATESINLAFRGTQGHIVTSNIEHHAVLECAKFRENTIVKSDRYGVISAKIVGDAIRSDTQLVSISLANNELGTIQPIREIAETIRQERIKRLESNNSTPIYFHCDASQGVSQLDVSVARLGVDMLTLNSGKMYGPKQVGLLWKSSNVNLSPQIAGGGQEGGLRSGTENVPGVVGFARALELVSDHRKYETERLSKLRDGLQKTLSAAFTDSVVSGHKKHRLAGHLSISFPGIDGERLLFLLENKGVLVATGSACAANSGLRSHVLVAIGLTPELIDGSLRITLGQLSNTKNIESASKIIVEEVRREYDRLGL